jgi:quercetin dioxygenase-like cupin family protein
MENIAIPKKSINAMEIDPRIRHEVIFDEFMKLDDGESLEVIVDHRPDHLLMHMQHAGLPVDPEMYRATLRDDGIWSGIFVRSATGGNGSGIVIASYDTKRNYDSKKFSAVPVKAGGEYGVLITYLKAGQFIPVHSPGVDLIFQVFRGNGTAVAGDREFRIKQGDIFIVPKGEKRGIRAETDMEALHIVVPFPGDEDHQEVEQKLASGKFD